MKLGTLAWAAQTKGRLRAIDHLVFARQAVQAVLAARWARWRKKFGASSTVPQVLPKVPRSTAADAALALCTQVSAPWLLNHCSRTYVWGSLLAELEGLRFDAELLYVTCMFHDLGLAPAVRARRTEPCFAVAGAYEAQTIAREQLGWSAERAAQLAEAISLHLNLTMSPADGVEAYLLHEGAGLDVVGARLRQVPRPLRDEALVLHPRGGQNQSLTEVCRQEAARERNTRVGFSFNRLGGAERVLRCPLG